ncbi:unnamed protein product [Durusdinium trenchii]|uniref:PARP catalytic domain-containing protein n=1 Tax=Durusdinium trenchii TaxID=1381693 RepID=A0ABP0QSB9_9DINO
MVDSLGPPRVQEVRPIPKWSAMATVPDLLTSVRPLTRRTAPTVPRRTAIGGPPVLAGTVVVFHLALQVCHRRRPRLRTRRTAESAHSSDVVYEFFSGLGGLRLGYTSAERSLPARARNATRFRAYEIDQVCCQVYEDLYGARALRGVQHMEPWMRASKEDELWCCSIDRLPDAAFEGADLWLMSPPCQPFTRTGRRRDVWDPRCKALLRLLDALPRLEQKPKGLLLENVPEFQHSVAHARLTSTLHQCGYATREALLTPLDFGFPNSRQRFYLLAARAARTDHASLSLSSTEVVKPVGQFLEDAQLDSLQVPSHLLKEAFDGGLSLDLATRTSLATKTFTAGYGKTSYGAVGLSRAGPLLYDAAPLPPERRLVAEKRFTMSLPADMWSQVRYFAPKEVANLMGFPRTWSLPGDLPCRTQWRLLGNSVNVSLVEEVIHVENPDNYLRYAMRREKVRQELQSKPMTGTELDDANPIKTKQVSLKGLSFHPDEPIDEKLQEVWLWHGTGKEGAAGITDTDFDMGRAGSAAGTMFGRGLYFAESCMKSDEYTKADERDWYPLILCRVTCGRLFYCDWKSPSDHKEKLEDACHHEGFHCVLGDREKVRGTYREFIVFDNDQVYPEYIVWYSR